MSTLRETLRWESSYPGSSSSGSLDLLNELNSNSIRLVDGSSTQTIRRIINEQQPTRSILGKRKDENTLQKKFDRRPLETDSDSNDAIESFAGGSEEQPMQPNIQVGPSVEKAMVLPVSAVYKEKQS